MRRWTYILSILFVLTSSITLAQTEQNENTGAQVDQQNADEPGLSVNRILIKNRLERVEVKHNKSGLVEYYDMTNLPSEHQEGSLTERNVMRKWRFNLK